MTWGRVLTLSVPVLGSRPWDLRGFALAVPSTCSLLSSHDQWLLDLLVLVYVPLARPPPLFCGMGIPSAWVLMAPSPLLPLLGPLPWAELPAQLPPGLLASTLASVCCGNFCDCSIRAFTSPISCHLTWLPSPYCSGPLHRLSLHLECSSPRCLAPLPPSSPSQISTSGLF